MFLTLKQLFITAGGEPLLTIPALTVDAQARIGLVGANGSGKSTLLNCLYGSKVPDAGHIYCQTPIAMIAQNADGQGVASSWWLKRLGVTSVALSGGQKTRRAIAVALSKEAPLLLADEPTTNLDMDGILLVEDILKTYNGAIILVSHDRRLLDNVCSTIWAVEDGTIRVFPGNYSDYLAQWQQERRTATEDYLQYKAETKRLTEAAKAIKADAHKMTNTAHLLAKGRNSKEIKGAKPFFAAAARRKAKQGKAVEKRLAQLPVKEKPQALPTIHMQLGNVIPITARKAMVVKDLTVGYHEHTVITKATFSLPTGSCTAIIGPNGSGKSTLVKALLADNEAVTKAPGLKIGYFAQSHEQLAVEQTVLANARAHSQLPESDVRTILAQLGFHAHALSKTVDQLSCGQRAKVAFAQLLASDCNLLILDEPTNHLDTFAQESLEQLLQWWGGTLLVVTHDRQLADKIAQRLLVVDHGQVTTFVGNLSEYLTAIALPPPKVQAEVLDNTILEMRTAELAGKIALARQKHRDTTQLERQLQDLLNLATPKKERD